MRIFVGCFLAVATVACRPMPAPIAPNVPKTARAEKVEPLVAPPAAVVERPAAPPAPPRVRNREISSILFEGIAFDSRSYRLAVADQLGGPGSRFADAAAAAQSLGGLAAANAGFFTPEGAPLGRVVSQGRATGSWNTASSLGSGVWFETNDRQCRIARRGAIPGNIRELIQAGPLLVENRRPVGGLDSTKSRVRTLVAWDGGTRWWLGRTTPCTLAGLAAAMTNGQPAGWPVVAALNLDGGRSADLWISGKIAGGPLVRRPLWNRPVRNFLVLLPR